MRHRALSSRYRLRLATLTCAEGFRLAACLTSSLAEVVPLPIDSTATNLIGLRQPSPQAFLASGLRGHRQLTPETEGREDVGDSAILVFGQLLTEAGSPTDVLRLRLKKAAEVFTKAGSMPIVVSGGDPKKRGVTEAKVMHDLLVTSGVPASNIILETESHNTLQNALNVLARYGREDGLLPRTCKRLLVVTSGFHMPRCAYLFEAALRHYHLDSIIALEFIPVEGGCPEPSDVEGITDPNVNQMTLLQRLRQERGLLSDIEHHLHKDSLEGVTVNPLSESRKREALAMVDDMIDKVSTGSRSSEIKSLRIPRRPTAATTQHANLNVDRQRKAGDKDGAVTVELSVAATVHLS